MSTETIETKAEPRLWTPQGFAEDGWVHAELVAADANQRVILPLAALKALPDDQRKGLGGRIGVLLLPGEPVEELEPFLADLALVALAFPAYNDGRSFSKAEILRRRYRFEGVVRATGDVLIDQIPHMLRLGFDAFEVTNAVAIARLEAGRIGGIAQHYQPAVRPEGDPVKYSWRRVAALG